MGSQYEHVPGELIAATAHYRNWKVAGHSLGRPIHIGLGAERPIHPLQFSKVPGGRKHNFIEDLPKYVESQLTICCKMEVLEIWELQTRTTKESEWRFDGKIVALVGIFLPCDNCEEINQVAADWPGWYHYQSEYLVRLDYPGRFKYCTVCKHTAQDLERANCRHTNDGCTKLICGVCGHAGHDSEKSTGYSRKMCNDKKKKRLQEQQEEARKKQKTSGQISQSDATGSSHTITPDTKSSPN